MIEKSTLKSLCRYSNSMTSLMKRIVYRRSSPEYCQGNSVWKFVLDSIDKWQSQWKYQTLFQSFKLRFSVLWSPVILVVLVSVVLIRVGGVEAPSGRREMAGYTRIASGMILQSEVWAPAQRASLRSGTCNTMKSGVIFLAINIQPQFPEYTISDRH